MASTIAFVLRITIGERPMKIASVKEIPSEKVEMDGAKDCQVKLAVTARDGAPNFAMRIFEVTPGDVLYIPTDAQHQFKNASDQAFKFMCLIPAKFQKC